MRFQEKRLKEHCGRHQNITSAAKSASKETQINNKNKKKEKKKKKKKKEKEKEKEKEKKRGNSNGEIKKKEEEEREREREKKRGIKNSTKAEGAERKLHHDCDLQKTSATSRDSRKHRGERTNVTD